MTTPERTDHESKDSIAPDAIASVVRRAIYRWPVPPEHHEEIRQAYLDYAGPLQRFARATAQRSGLSEADLDSEGVVHDAFIKATVRWGSVEWPKAYLFAVVRYMVARKARAIARWRPAGSDEAFDWPLPHALAGGPSTELAVSYRRVLEVLTELPERQAVAVYLHHIAGHSYAEIGEILGCAEGTVGVHIYRGVQRIRHDPLTFGPLTDSPRRPHLESRPNAAPRVRPMRPAGRPLRLLALIRRVWTAVRDARRRRAAGPAQR